MDALYEYSLDHRVGIVLCLHLAMLSGLMLLGRWSSYHKVPRDRTSAEPLRLSNLLGDEPDGCAAVRDWLGATADMAFLLVLASATLLGCSVLFDWLGEAVLAHGYWISSLVCATLPLLLIGPAIDMKVWIREMK